MKILFDDLHIENFMSIGQIDINLSNQSYVLISGQNNNAKDAAKSNGSGKSSIFEALVWCLTGETVRGYKHVTNKYGTDGAFVSLDFDVDNVHYCIERYKEHSKFGTNLKICRDGIDISGKGIRDSEKILTEYLPELSMSLINSVIVLGQGLPAKFTSNTASGRKEMLEKLCKSDFMIQDMKSRISTRKDVLQSDIKLKNDELLAAQVKIDMLERNVAELSEQLEKCKPDDTEALQASLQNLNTTKATHTTTVEESRKHLAELKESIFNLKVDYASELTLIETKWGPSKEALDKSLIEKQVIFNNLNKEIKAIKSIVDICPTCKQKIIGVVKPNTTNQEEQLTTLGEEIDEIQTKLKNISRSKTVDINHATESFQTKEITLVEEQQACESSISKDEQILKQLEYEITQIKEKLIKNQTIEERRKELKNSLSKNEDDIAELNKAIKTLTIQIDDLNTRLGIVNKFNQVVAREFRGYLLSDIVEFICKKARAYCIDIFDNDLIEIKLDGNNISINYAGKEYEALSGGEKQKIDIIVQFAIRDMLQVYSNFSSNLIVLDEIFDNLDSVGCDKVINLISTKLNDLSSIFIVTHHSAELNIPYDTELVVVKNNDGISSIQ